MKLRNYLLILACIYIADPLFAQLPPLERIEPAFWWAGMKQSQLQLIVHGNNIAARTVELSYTGITLKQVHKVENPNYLFLDLEIAATAAPGSFAIRFTAKGQKELRYTYELKARDHAKKAQGVTSADFIYLIMPDRFANGDPKNDIVKGMQQVTLNRDSMYYRHGGCTASTRLASRAAT